MKNYIVLFLIPPLLFSLNLGMADYIEEIRKLLTTARKNAYTAVNSAMVDAYWLIGKRMGEQEQHGQDRAAYGEGI